MEYLATQARSALYELDKETADGLYERLDWNVQEDTALEGAEPEVVKRCVLPDRSPTYHPAFEVCFKLFADMPKAAFGSGWQRRRSLLWLDPGDLLAS